MISIQFLAVIMLISAGITAAITRKNLLKIIIAVDVIGSGINLFLISIGYREGAIAPIFTGASSLQMVLPTPQALTLTSIVIDLAIVALMLSFTVSIYEKYGTLDTRRGRLKG